MLQFSSGDQQGCVYDDLIYRAALFQKRHLKQLLLVCMILHADVL